MKKKGLIISTIVMVVVLVASLTTATYAWFSVTAAAEISDINIETRASDGLSIAAYKMASDGAVTYTNGGLTLDSDNVWFNESALGFGSILTLTPNQDGNQIEELYGVSGDGATLFKNSAEQQALDSNGKPENLELAVANENYFVLDFVLQNVSDRTADIYINEISVTPSNGNTRMAGATRIAVFAVNDISTSALTPSVGTNGIFLYDPYGDYGYDGATWSTGRSDKTSTVYATQAGAYNTVMSTDPLSTLWGGKYLTYGSINSTNLTANGGPIAAALAKTYNDTDTATVLRTSASQGQYVYVKLVIWFDGEDNACVQAAAGGGITVGVNFTLDQAPVVGP